MRLYKCPKVSKYLLAENLIDDRQIWCYAQAKAKIKLYDELVKIYGLMLVCVKHDSLFLYAAEFDSTKLELMYTCKISEIKEISYKKKCLSTILTFSKDEETFKLDMDDWKRFAPVFGKVNI